MPPKMTTNVGVKRSVDDEVPVSNVTLRQKMNWTANAAAFPEGRFIDGFTASFQPADDNSIELDPRQVMKVEVETQPRLKKSSASGDEWRYYVAVSVHLHDGTVHQIGNHDIQRAVGSLHTLISTGHVQPKGTIDYQLRWKGQTDFSYFARDVVFASWHHFLAKLAEHLHQTTEHGDDWHQHQEAFEQGSPYCMNHACSNKATKFVRLKERFTQFGTMLHDSVCSRDYRWFCEEHCYRGDCSRSDSDANYEIVTVEQVCRGARP
jgi:hypothetical protein